MRPCSSEPYNREAYRVLMMPYQGGLVTVSLVTGRHRALMMPCNSKTCNRDTVSIGLATVSYGMRPGNMSRPYNSEHMEISKLVPSSYSSPGSLHVPVNVARLTTARPHPMHASLLL